MSTDLASTGFLGFQRPGSARPLTQPEEWVTVGTVALASYVGFLVLNPFLALFFLAILAVFVRGPSRLQLGFLALTLASFYASREIGVTWGSGSDDVPYYVQIYLADQQIGLIDLFTRFLADPGNNEVLYHTMEWLFGQATNSGPGGMIFFTYLVQTTLLGVVAYLVSPRFAIVFVIVFFFGMGDPHPALLHLWRANVAVLVFLIGVLLWSQQKVRPGAVLIIASAGFHLSLIPFIVVFAAYNALIRRARLPIAIAIGMAVTFFSASLIAMVVETVFPAKVQSYFIVSQLERNITQALVLTALVIANLRWTLSPAARALTFMFAVWFVLQIVFQQYPPVLARLGQVAAPSVSIPLFEILMKQRKYVTGTIIVVLFIRLLLAPTQAMYAAMMPDYRAPLHGALRVLF